MPKKPSRDDKKKLLNEESILPKSWQLLLDSNKATLLILIACAMVLLVTLEGISKGLGMLVAVLGGSVGIYTLLFKK
jgi:hypothetical protein